MDNIQTIFSFIIASVYLLIILLGVNGIRKMKNKGYPIFIPIILCVFFNMFGIILCYILPSAKEVERRYKSTNFGDENLNKENTNYYESNNNQIKTNQSTAEYLRQNDLNRLKRLRDSGAINEREYLKEYKNIIKQSYK